MVRFLSLALALVNTAPSTRAAETKLEYAPAPIANPLKGLVPYPGASDQKKFPHSMEFVYQPLGELVVGERNYDWGKFDSQLRETAGRGHQVVARIYIEFPKKASALPAHLEKDSLRADGFPDYESPRLRQCLRDFIAAFGKRYDGDARLGFLCAGLLGKWGEWHTWPEEDRWASEAVQVEALDAYQTAFKKTPVVLRYPRGPDEKDAANATRPFGYHDDSFAWSTLRDGSQWDDSHFVPLLEKAGAAEKWRRFPIGGEIRPEAWGLVFDQKPADPKVQNFATCVEATHVSWLMDSGLFNDKTWTPQRRQNAEKLVRRMGYEFHVPSVKTESTGDKLHITVQIENRGVAPFYADWPIEWAMLDADTGAVVRSQKSTADLRQILPGTDPVTRDGSLAIGEQNLTGRCLAMRIVNPMKRGLPLRFANKTQDQHAEGWLTLLVF